MCTFAIDEIKIRSVTSQNFLLIFLLEENTRLCLSIILIT